MESQTPSPLRSICVFCGSANGGDPAFAQSAQALGKSLAQAGIRLVYGGGNSGLMGEVARSTLQHGGHVTGIIPEFLKVRELMLHGAQEMIVVPDMHARKMLMFERSDAFIALPGGIGTLEELFEQMTWAQLDRHVKPVLIANIAGFWSPLLALIEHVRDGGFIRQGLEARFLVASRVEEMLPAIKRAMAGRQVLLPVAIAQELASS